MVDAHKNLGHCLEALSCKAAQYYDWKLTHEGMPTCKDCATGKGHQKDVVKDSEHVSLEVLSDRICADITSMKRENNEYKGYSKLFWLLAVDIYSHMKFLWFLNKKSRLSGVLHDFMKKSSGTVWWKVQFNTCQHVHAA